MVGRMQGSSPANEAAHVWFDITFTEKEKESKLLFKLRGYLIEVNQSVDNYYMAHDGKIIQRPNGQPDRIVGQIFEVLIAPPEKLKQTMNYSKVWDFGSFGAGTENFRAVLTVVPSVPNVNPQRAISAQVIIDMG
jgi:hypothetical protein